MPKQTLTQPSYPKFQSQLGLRLFWSHRIEHPPGVQFDPAPLGMGRIAFTFTEKGQWWHVLNGERHLNHTGDLCVVRGGDLSGVIGDNHRPHTVNAICLSLEQGGVANILLQREWLPHYTLSRPRKHIAIFNAIREAGTLPGALRELGVFTAVLQFIMFILKETEAPLRKGGEFPEKAVDKAQLAQVWALSNLHRNFRMSEWARVVGLHPAYFDRLFRSYVLLTPRRWLERRRMQVARHTLLSTRKAIKQVAQEVGFQDPFYFSSVFRKHYKMSPLQCRKQATTR